MSNLVTLRPRPGDVVESVYHVECELASDASSVVLGAVVPATGKRYLLRCWLNEGGAGPAAAIQHFVRVANSVQLFSQPGIVEVFGIGQTNGLFYEVTEWLEGTSLKRWLDRVGPMSVRAALSLLLPCLESLAAAHAAGIVHGDLRLGNVFIARSSRFEPERARLLNFHHGNWPDKPVLLPKRLSDDVSLAQFLSPEELQGRPADSRSDVYAIGVMLYVMLAGRSPYSADTLNELAVEILDGQTTALSARVPGISPAFEQLVARAMTLDPSERFQNMAELLVQLARVEGHENEALAKHAPLAQTFTWIKPVTDYVSTSLFDFPVLSEAELAAARRVARNRSILHACVAVSFAVMFAAILFRVFEPSAAELRAERLARAAAAREASQLLGLTASNALPAPDHASRRLAPPVILGGEVAAVPLESSGSGSIPDSSSRVTRPSAPARGQAARPSTAPPQAAAAKQAVVSMPVPVSPAPVAAPAPPTPSSSVSPPSAPAQSGSPRQADALDRMRIE